MNLVQRLDGLIQKKDDKRNELKRYYQNEKREKELKECTFQPSINSKTKRKKRTVDDLYNWQKEKIRKITQKEIQKAKHEKKIIAKHPKALRNSRKILKKNLKENKENRLVSVEDRLLDQQKKKEEKIKKLREAQIKGFFMPKISDNIPSPKYRIEKNNSRRSIASVDSNHNFSHNQYDFKEENNFYLQEEKVKKEAEISVPVKTMKRKSSRKSLNKNTGFKKHRRVNSYQSNSKQIKPKTDNKKSLSRNSSYRLKTSHRPPINGKKIPKPSFSRKNSQKNLSNVESKLGLLCEEFKNLSSRYGRKNSNPAIQNTFDYFYENCPVKETDDNTILNMKRMYNHEEDDKKLEKSSRKNTLRSNYSEKRFEKAQRSIRKKAKVRKGREAKGRN